MCETEGTGKKRGLTSTQSVPFEPYFCSPAWRMKGNTIPAMEVPAVMTPYAKPV